MAAKSKPLKTAKEEPPSKTDLRPAFLRTIKELNISPQNVLAFISVFVVPFVALVLGAPLAVALAVGSCIMIWYLVCKTLRHARSIVRLVASGVAGTVVVLGAGIVIATFIRSNPKANSVGGSPRPPQLQQHYETHGPQSPIMPDNKGSVTISNQESSTPAPKKDEKRK